MTHRTRCKEEHTAFNVVKSIGYPIDTGKETLSVNVWFRRQLRQWEVERERTLRIRTDRVLPTFDVTFEIGVHLCHSGCGNSRLEIAQVFCAEQELAIEVALLDGVKISHINGAVGPRSEANH